MANQTADYTKHCEVYFERSLDIKGFSYLVIFGHHINGGFLALPGWNIACEATDRPGNVHYNVQKLTSAGLPAGVAWEIANVTEEWLGTNRG